MAAIDTLSLRHVGRGDLARKREELRDVIRAAAIIEFAEHGLRGASTQGIARPRRHFENQAALLHRQQGRAVCSGSGPYHRDLGRAVRKHPAGQGARRLSVRVYRPQGAVFADPSGRGAPVHPRGHARRADAANRLGSSRARPPCAPLR